MNSVSHGDVEFMRKSCSKNKWLKNRNELSNWKKLEKKLTVLRNSAKPSLFKRAMSLSEDWLPCKRRSRRKKVR